MNKLILYILLIFLIVPTHGTARHRNKRLFPLTKHHQLKYEYIDELQSGRMLVRDFTGKYGYTDSNMKEVLPCIYDYAQPFCNGKAAVMKGKKCGLIDTLGNELIPCIYNKLRQQHRKGEPDELWTCNVGRYVIAEDDSATYIYDLLTKQAILPEYRLSDYEYYDGNKYQITRKNHKDGLALENGKLATPELYDRIYPESEGKIRVARNGKTAFLDTNLNPITGFIYNNAKDFHEGLAAVQIDNLWGFIDQYGIVAIEPCYQHTEDFVNNIAVVKENMKYGIINKEGTKKIPCIYDSIAVTHNKMWPAEQYAYGIIPVCLNEKWALIDTDNTLRTPFLYSSIVAVKEGYRVEINNLKGLVSNNVSVSTAVKYNDISFGAELGYYTAELLGKWTVIDSNYKQILADTFSSRLIANNAMKRIIYNAKYDRVKPGQEQHYMSALDFSKRLAIVENTQHKWGFINKKGKEIIKCEYSDLGIFVGRKAYVEINNKSGHINKKGKIIGSLRTDTFRLQKNAWQVTNNRKVGIVNDKNELIIPYLYDEISTLSKGRLLVGINGQYGCVDLKGNILLPIEYAMIYADHKKITLLKGRTGIIMNNRLRRKIVVDSSLDISWERATVFAYHLAMVSDSTDKCGYINQKGKLKIPFRYNKAEDFSHNRAVVRIDTKANKNNDDDIKTNLSIIDMQDDTKGMINRRGKLVVPCIYQDIKAYVPGMPIRVKHEHYDKYGFVNKKGKLLTPHMFTNTNRYYVRSFRGWACIWRNNKWIYLNKRGKVKLELPAAKSDRNF